MWLIVHALHCLVRLRGFSYVHAKLQDAGAIVSLYASGPAKIAKQNFKRLTAVFPDSNDAYVITLDRDTVYVVKTVAHSK